MITTAPHTVVFKRHPLVGVEDGAALRSPIGGPFLRSIARLDAIAVQAVLHASAGTCSTLASSCSCARGFLGVPLIHALLDAVANRSRSSFALRSSLQQKGMFFLCMGYMMQEM